MPWVSCIIKLQQRIGTDIPDSKYRHGKEDGMEENRYPGIYEKSPWETAMGRVLMGIGLTSLTLNFWTARNSPGSPGLLCAPEGKYLVPCLLPSGSRPGRALLGHLDP